MPGSDPDGGEIPVFPSSGTLPQGVPTEPRLSPHPLELALIRRERQLAVLLHANRQLSHQRTQSALLHVVLEAAAELTGAVNGCAGLIDGATLIVTKLLRDGVVVAGCQRIGAGDGAVAKAVSGREIVVQCAFEGPVCSAIPQGNAAQRLVCVPIKDSSGEILGCFEMYDPVSCRAQDEGDRSILQGLASMAAVALENGRIVSERQKARRETAAASSLLSATLESTPDGIMAVDANGEITAVNRRFVEMWGISDMVIAGGDSTEVLMSVLEGVRDPVSFFDRVTELYWHPEEESHDIVELNDGRCFERFSKPQFREGKAIGRVWTFHDMTELKRLQAQLLHSQKMEAVGTLAGGIAHDFNNIMTVIKGYASLLKTELNPPAPFDAFLQNIDAASHRAAALIRSLLAYSRKETAQTSSVECNTLVRNLVELLSRLIGEDIELVTSPAPEPLTIQADRGQIEQVLVNLCTNARDAMPGGGKICIGISRSEVGADHAVHRQSAAPHVVITVSDTGCGMDAETLQRIFEPFYTTKPVGSGTGLGLSISYGIVKQHGGFITVGSGLGRGTTFSLHLPLDMTPSAVDPAEENTASLPPALRGAETLLLVEDNAMVRTLIREVLNRSGYNVIEAVDGQDGVEKFEVHAAEIDLVIMDVLMPRKNGGEAFREIRLQSPGMKVIFISGYTGDSIDRKVVRQADGFLLKPVKPRRLLSLLRQVLSEKDEVDSGTKVRHRHEGLSCST